MYDKDREWCGDKKRESNGWSIKFNILIINTGWLWEEGVVQMRNSTWFSVVEREWGICDRMVISKLVYIYKINLNLNLYYEQLYL